MKTVWIVGIWKGHAGEMKYWELVGIFTSEKKALKAAKQSPVCFVAPVEMGKDYGIESTEMPGSYYPTKHLIVDI